MKRTDDNSENRSLLERLDMAQDNAGPVRGNRTENRTGSRRIEEYSMDGRRNRPEADNYSRRPDRESRQIKRDDNYRPDRESRPVRRDDNYRPERESRNGQRQNTSLTVRNESRPAVRRDPRREGNYSMTRQGQSPARSTYSRDPRIMPGRTDYYKKRRKKKKGSKAFTIGLIVFAAVLAIGVTIALLVLSSFLKTYETSLPVNVVEQVIADLSEGRYESYDMVAYDETPISDDIAFATEGYFSNYFKEKMSAGEVSYRKLNGESTDTTFIYAVRVGDDDFLKLSLNKQPEEASFGLSTWKAAGGQVLDSNLVMKSIRIQAPQDATVYVNGIALDDTYVVSSNVIVEQLKNLVDSWFLAEEDAAYVKELSVQGLFADAKVTLKNADGTEEDCVQDEDFYSGGFKATDEFVAERIDRVTEMIYPWCYYFSGDGSFYELSQYIWDYSPAYNTIQAADTSWMQEHSDIGIDNIVVDNFRKYSDTCFSCDVRFQENIYQWGTLARTWDSYMTWIYINGSSTFYLADYITHNASEK